MAQEFKVDKAKTDLEQLRAKRRDLSKARSGLEEVTTKSAIRPGEQRANLSKLDNSIEDYKGYKQTIADLSTGLTDSLTQYVNFASNRQSFEGVEKFAKFFGASKWAHRHRLGRIEKQGPRENLKLVLQFAADLVTEIRDVQGDAIERMTGLQVSINDVVNKIAEYEPLEEKYKERLDALEADYKAVEEKNKTAGAAEQAQYAVELNEKHKVLVTARAEYDEVLTVYNQAKQALQPNREAFSAFEQMVRDLGIQAVQINEKMVDIEQVYLAAPEAMEIMMKTKGMEQVDQALNVGVQESLKMITGAAIGVADATMRRQEQELVEADFMRDIMGRMHEMSNDFKTRQEKVAAQAHKSLEDRYGTPSA